MDFEYEYTVSGTAYVNLDLIIGDMIDDVSGKPDIEKFDEAYWDYADRYIDYDVASEIEDNVRAEIIKRIKEEDDGKED